MSPINETYGLLSALNALLGAVTPNLRAFTIQVFVQEKIVKAALFYDGKISDEDFDIANCALTEIISDFPPDYTLEENIERLDYPAAIPIVGRLVFQRKED